MTSSIYYSASELEKLRSQTSYFQIDSDEYPNGWSKSKVDPMKVLNIFTSLKIKKGFTLRAYQYIQDGDGNGIVWAMPENAEFPEPDDCPKLNNEFLDYPHPPQALDDVMMAIEGDTSDLSYLEASIFAREISEFGAVWHGCSWSTHSILDEKKILNNSSFKNIDEWTWLNDKPSNWNPSVCDNQDKKTITFYTFSRLGVQSIYRHTDTFIENKYVFKSNEEILAKGNLGFVF